MIKGRALDHIGIACTDVEKDAAWYMDTLGFTLKGKFRSAGRKYYTYFVDRLILSSLALASSLPCSAASLYHFIASLTDLVTPVPS